MTYRLYYTQRSASTQGIVRSVDARDHESVGGLGEFLSHGSVRLAIRKGTCKYLGPGGVSVMARSV